MEVIEQNQQLVNAVKDGLYDDVRNLIKDCSNIHFDRDCLLRIACENNDQKMARIIIGRSKNTRWFEEAAQWMYSFRTVGIPPHVLGHCDGEPLPRNYNKDDWPKKFDPNFFFLILKRIQMKEHYTLTYRYFSEGSFGHPCMYVRKITEKEPIPLMEAHSWKFENDITDYLILDGSLESFLELSIFLEMNDQFYLYWHSCHGYSEILTDQTIGERPDLINELKISDDLIKKMKPAVKTIEEEVHVSFCTYSNRPSLTLHEEVYRTRFPHHRIQSKKTELICVEREVFY